MRSGTNLRGWLKKRIPTPIRRYLRFAYSLKAAFHYWFPYNFMGGKAWPPTELTLDITYVCNLKCQMCPQAIDFESEDSNLLKQYQTRSELTTEQIFQLVESAADFGVKVFTLTGGEVFLRKDVLAIVERIKQRGMQCHMITNGMLLSKATVARLVELEVDHISISVDGPERIHNAIRKHPKAFQRLVETVELIQAEKKRQKKYFPGLRFGTTIVSGNAEYLGELTEIAGKHGVSVNFAYVYYVSKQMEAETAEILNFEEAKPEDQNIPESLTRIDHRVIGAQIEEVQLKAREHGIEAQFVPKLTPEEVRLRYEDDSYAYADKCFYAWYRARVNPYGDMYACGPISMPMGNITEQSLPEIWNGPRYREFRQTLRKHRLLPMCPKCCTLNKKLWSYLPRVVG